MSLTLPQLRAAVRAHLEEAYPGEGVGAVWRGPLGVRYTPLANVAKAPRRGFAVDVGAWVAAQKAAARAGERLVALVHSHPDGEAALSAEDVAGFVVDGEETYPGVFLLVAAIEKGAWRALSAYAYERDRKEFRRFKGGLAVIFM